MDIILETERLYLREMNQADFNSLCKILQDEDTMYAYEGAFSDDEVQEWLDRQISRYHKCCRQKRHGNNRYQDKTLPWRGYAALSLCCRVLKASCLTI